MMNFIAEHWEGLASILLSVASIGIAIGSARSTSKDASRQIASVKELSALQIDTTIKLLEVEIQKVITNVKIASEESSAMDKINNSDMPKEWEDEMTRRYYASKSQMELKIYSDCTHNLKEILKNVQDLKRN
ncbi:MAG: hypothetical protein J6L60_11340 [Bacteroidaceae bacterium]|nr:hypothetical protein [Bacteroidaceae bacterium]MBQ5740547.1 hypothetical protein [Bacteroidaceae bacterium]